MSQIIFYTGTLEQYNALESKNENALYFLTDVCKLYKGSTLYTQMVEVVSSFPESGKANVLYVKSDTYETRQWNGTAWVTIALPIATSISTHSDNAAIPTALAVKSYVDGQISEVNSGVSGAVANVTYADKSISVQKGSGTPTVTALTGFVDGATYDGSTGELAFTTNGGTPIKVNLPVENFLASASFNHENNDLTLTLTSGESVTCNLADLVDTYSGNNGASVNVNIDGGVVTASVNVSGETGNIVTTKSDGIYATVDISAQSGNMVSKKSDGIFASLEWNVLA